METSLPEFFESFSDARREGFLRVKELKDSGKNICGVFCSYSPTEVILAAGLYSVGLCGRSNDPIKTAETRLPANLCPLIKASFGHALEDSCPYAFFSDIVVGETTCDGKKKMYELLGEMKPLHSLHLPNVPNYDRSLDMWVTEIRRFKEALEERFHVEITDEKLNEAIVWCNKERALEVKLYEMGLPEPPMIRGAHVMDVLVGEQFIFDRKEKYQKLQAVIQKCIDEYNAGNGPWEEDPCRPRIIVSGAGLSGASSKTVDVIEELGGAIVCYEGCGGVASFRRLVDEDTSRDPIVRLAEKYLEVPCAVVSPNHARMEQIDGIIKEWRADGIISITLHACSTFAIETENVRRVAEKNGIPLLHIITDFSPNDAGQIRTRIEAFLETIREKKRNALGM